MFLDDLGVNLKPARAMGMDTIKVNSQEQALKDLSQQLNVDLLATIHKSKLWQLGAHTHNTNNSV